MTLDEFHQALQAIASRFYGSPSTDATERAFKSEVTSLVADLYAQGDMLADRLGPIFSWEDVEIIVTRGKHSLSAAAIRKTTHPQL